jgi:hypothetical protein
MMTFDDFVGYDYNCDNLSTNPNGISGLGSAVIICGGVSIDARGKLSGLQVGFGPGIGLLFQGVQHTSSIPVDQ